MHVPPGFLRLGAGGLHRLRGPSGRELALRVAKPLAKDALGRAARLLALLFVILGGTVPAVAADDRLAAPSLATASYAPDIGIAEGGAERWAEAAQQDRAAADDEADDPGPLPAALSATAMFSGQAVLPALPSASRPGRPSRAYQARAPPIV